jgi:uncharacterized membrane protein YdcZ (DUF606 family)
MSMFAEYANAEVNWWLTLAIAGGFLVALVGLIWLVVQLILGFRQTKRSGRARRRIPLWTFLGGAGEPSG